MGNEQRDQQSPREFYDVTQSKQHSFINIIYIYIVCQYCKADMASGLCKEGKKKSLFWLICEWFYKHFHSRCHTINFFLLSCFPPTVCLKVTVQHVCGSLHQLKAAGPSWPLWYGPLSHTHTYTQINKHRIPEVNLRQTSTTQHTHIRMLCLSEWYCENQTPYRVSGTLPVLGSEPCAPILQNFSKTKTRALNHRIE